MSSVFYSARDGGLTSAGSNDGKNSPFTGAYLYFLKGNPGAKYPEILNEF
jgi:hypothetical protein